MRILLRAWITMSAAILCGSIVFAQGSLTPSGAPGPTLKTLQQVEPRIDVATLPNDWNSDFVITVPGSYYLSENITVTTNSHGVDIQATNVTLDLNGFEISRLSGSGGAGVFIYGAADNAKVINGSVRGFGYGVYHASSPRYAKGALIEKVSTLSCDYGMFGGYAVRVHNCQVNDFGTFGIWIFDGGAVKDCTVSGGTGSTAVNVGKGSVVSGCVVYSNAMSSGIISAGWGSVVKECSVYQNTAAGGISAARGSVISDCVVSDNQLDTCISVSDDSVVAKCVTRNNTGVATANTYGIAAYRRCHVIDCVSAGNGNTNSPTTSDQGIGIRLQYRSTVRGCTVSDNSGDGIFAQNECYIQDNNSNRNGSGATADGAGIHAFSNGNRIDGNTVTYNDRGIDVDDDNNFIVRNTASGNSTDYEIVADNLVGTIIVPSNSYAITGGSVTGAVGVAPFNFSGIGFEPRDDSWANFSF